MVSQLIMILIPFLKNNANIFLKVASRKFDQFVTYETGYMSLIV